MRTTALVLLVSLSAAAGCGRDELDRDDRVVVRDRDTDTDEIDVDRTDRTGRTGFDTTTVRTGTLGRTAAGDRPVDADNTGVNVRDRDDFTRTPEDQGGTEADRQRTADIRKRITDLDLSVDAENVKVVTTAGRVTLRGPVKSQSEKDTIARIAREVAGADNVDDQLEVVEAR